MKNIVKKKRPPKCEQAKTIRSESTKTESQEKLVVEKEEGSRQMLMGGCWHGKLKMG